MKKIGKYLVIIFITVLFLGTFAYLFQRSKPKAAQYQELEPTVMDIVKSTIVTGKIQPRDEVNIKPQISGIMPNSTSRPAIPSRRTRSSPRSR